ncbi:MAG: type II toxin-antitoxin system RelE/ParE family toxin [Amphritea sp.]|nr:type II toxin-antitoxin system RelE/ParE family toxin [Amphritea sp.]
MAEIVWTEPALNNLEELAEYIAISNPKAAKRLVANVFEKIQRLTLFPESGRIPEEINTFNYREIVVNPCRIFYKYEGDSVYILHIIRQERDLKRYLLGVHPD